MLTAVRPALLIVLGLAILATAAGLVLHQRQPVPAPPATTTPSTAPQTSPAAGSAAAQQQPPARPSFDIVRINPQGDAVMAGRAEPGSKVTISDGGKPIGEAQADQNGNWVFVPTAKLPPGARELTLTQHAPDGHDTPGDRSVLLAVPDTTSTVAQNAPPPLAVATGAGAAPQVLTGPAPEAGGATGRLALGAMEYDEHGEVRFAGTAPPGASVRLYIDNRPVAGAAADQDGHWSMAARNALGTGPHRLRLDQVGPDGSVAARLERPFSRTDMAAVELPPGHVEIRPGQNLWLIARGAYGQGTRYTVIFQANKAQIRDPNLIYPGQVFALPASASSPAMPASSSTSK